MCSRNLKRRFLHRSSLGFVHHPKVAECAVASCEQARMNSCGLERDWAGRRSTHAALGGRPRVTAGLGLHESIDRHPEGFSEPRRDEERSTELAAFEARHVVARQARRFRELDLGPALLLTTQTNSLADARGEVVRVFFARVRVRLEPPAGLSTHPIRIAEGLAEGYPIDG